MPFVCPITLDDDVNANVVFMIQKGPSAALADVEKRQVDQILDCPLALLNRGNQEVMDKVLTRIKHGVSLQGF